MKLAKDNHCEIMIVYLPEINSNIKTPWQYDFFKEFGKVYFVPDSILTDKNNWKDDSHFNDTGAKIFSEFITNELIKKYR